MKPSSQHAESELSVHHGSSDQEENLQETELRDVHSFICICSNRNRCVKVRFWIEKVC